MTLEEKAKIALKEIQSTIPECRRVKFIGKWRKKDIFADCTEHLKETVFVGPTGIASVSRDGESKTIFLDDIISRDFPEIPE